MNLAADIKFIRKVIQTSLLYRARRELFVKRLDSIERRWNDRNLYVSIVGEFSSGKSTLIDELIGQEYVPRIAFRERRVDYATNN